ncbi:3-oxo-tetronate 4-phosphate decarboxylase [Kushneria indalinina]|uniref:3-oxo-tetronate 4-phosphate decarboxylase n=1 Tax=Kushneria indalinina DSM 14324 TaxID=1122140 RepID=A0A3D9DZV3_9GAMM|nr:3-oxo-tetronate 4-phosphate decarboxylase [Kushneria indalinina]REC95764.1 ribulose-5-phosphate 4-epimerase/fuculose-1-phosphate aldolase [Kushneria indalinina DSM 14324]
MSHINTHSEENRLREEISEIGRAFRQLGLAPGTSGNLSAKCDGGWLMTPTNASLGALDPAEISMLDWEGNLISGKPPTKESFLHRAFYESREEAGGVIHLHSTYASAVSCLKGLDERSCIPPITPYFVMRVGRLPLLPYFQPGDPAMGEAVRDYAPEYSAVLLANHGPVVAGKSLEAARNAIEELEETARLFLLLQGQQINTLDEAQIDGLRQQFGARW